MPTTSRARPPAAIVAHQRQRRRVDLSLEQLGHQALPGRALELSIAQGGAERRGGGHDAGEAEELVLDRLELGVGEILEHPVA